MGIESITLYPGEKEALLSKGYAARHVNEEYDIVSDETTQGGERTITLKKRDLTQETDDKKRLVSMICKKIGETPNGMFSKLLYDAIIDYPYAHIRKLIKAIEIGKPISAKPTHCFRLHVGDGRKKGSFTIALRD